MTNYEEYYHKGKMDKQAGKTMTLPNTIDIHNSYRGYMDGWSGREFCQPVGMQIKHEPRVTIN
jgi:hypothetical protein